MACMPRPGIPEDGHCLGDDLVILGKLLVQLVGYELRELSDGPIDIRVVSELSEELGD